MFAAQLLDRPLSNQLTGRELYLSACEVLKKDCSDNGVGSTGTVLSLYSTVLSRSASPGFQSCFFRATRTEQLCFHRFLPILRSDRLALSLGQS